MLTKSMDPAAKSTDTSEHIWLISQTGNTYTHIYCIIIMHTFTHREICDTPCPYDPYAPYGHEEGRENKHTARWVTAAWQPAKPRGPWCQSNIAMVGTTLFLIPILLSCFIYCSVACKYGGWPFFLFWPENQLNLHHCKSSKANKICINHTYTVC